MPNLQRKYEFEITQIFAVALNTSFHIYLNSLAIEVHQILK